MVGVTGSIPVPPTIYHDISMLQAASGGPIHGALGQGSTSNIGQDLQFKTAENTRSTATA